MGLTICIASGTGGAGTSTLARNMAVFLAQVGKRTAFVDLGGSLSGLEAFARVEERRVVTDAPTHLHLSPGLQNLEVFLARYDREGLWRDVRSRLESAEFEVVVADVRFDGSDFACQVMLSSPLRLLVARPDPTSVFEIYRSASAILASAVGRKVGAGRVPGDHDRTLAGFLSPRDLMEIAGPGEVRDAALSVVRSTRIGILVNMAQEREDFNLGRAIESFGTRVFALPLVDMGAIERDDAIGDALRHRIPLLLHMPYSKGGRDLEALVRRLLSSPDVDHVRPRLAVRGPDGEENLYEALEVDRGAGEHEIRKALKRVQDVLGGRTLASVEIGRPGVIDAMCERAARAHRTLLDRRLKREYDRSLIEAEAASLPLARAPGERPLRPAELRPLRVPDSPPLAPPETGVSGAWLASVREARGMSLEDVSSVSKVSVTYLAALEAEGFAELPARVYVRGFVTAYARALNLEVEPVVSGYLALMRR